MLSNWSPSKSRTFVSPFHRNGTLNGSGRHWMGNVSRSEQGSSCIPNDTLHLSGSRQPPKVRKYAPWYAFGTNRTARAARTFSRGRLITKYTPLAMDQHPV